jgi:hypothetical protein
MNNENTSNEQNFYSLALPSWDKWLKIKHARLWEAVALACNLSPSQFQFMGTEKLDTIFDRTTPQFKDLLSLAKANISNPLLKPLSYSAEGFEESQIELAKFGAWVKSIHFPVPPDFPWQDAPMLPMTREWPWGNYETENLRKLAMAANRFWKNYDPTDESTAHTSNEIIAWLIEQKVTPNMAKAMATILRADGLSTGRRKK